MVRCQRCGHDNDPSARFCVGCGNRLINEAQAAVAAPARVAPPAPPPSHDLVPAPAATGPVANPLGFAETSPPILDDDFLHAPRANRRSANPQDPAHYVDPHNPLRLAPDAPRVLAGFLVSFDGNALGQSWVIHQGTNLLGRLGASAGADIELPHATVSSRHATIAAAAHPGRMFLQDHGSTNGSYVNDVPLQPQQQHPLHDGDRVRLGLFNLIVKIV